MHPQLLPSALTFTLLAVLPTVAQEGSQVTAEAGLSVRLPCNLMGPSLRWAWLPRYPRCAGVCSELKTIYTKTAAGVWHVPLERFQTRLHHRMEPENRFSILELRPARMTDSGTFICASPSKEGQTVWVTINPGCQTGATIEAKPQPPMKGESVSLSCVPCGEEGPTASPKGEITWLLNEKPPPDSSNTRNLRFGSKVTIENFSSQFEGLWSCHLPGDPPRNGTYCLERIPGVNGNQEGPSPSPTQPATSQRQVSDPRLNLSPEKGTTAPTSNHSLPVIGGCVGAALVLILIGVGAFICCRRRKRKDISVTSPAPKPEMKLNSVEVQPGPPDPAGAKQSVPAPDLKPEDEAPGGIQYATVHFREPDGTVSRVEADPATIYSQVATRPD